MSLSRRDFLKFGSATAAGVAVGNGVDLAPVSFALRADNLIESIELGWPPDRAAGFGGCQTTEDLRGPRLA